METRESVGLEWKHTVFCLYTKKEDLFRIGCPLELIMMVHGQINQITPHFSLIEYLRNRSLFERCLIPCRQRAELSTSPNCCLVNEGLYPADIEK
ncbi:conserved hypothetical protein [Ricinus communis]|uniref:Uncharacterized protein n=1 Tax=Ricinus communis TaxID=3988 RepID=B9SSC4_RICCO|nr:conserved hypothetical protein [Ricinus communis]